MKTDTRAFISALTATYSEDDPGIRGASPDEFSPAFIAAVDSFIAGFLEHLEAKGIERYDSERSFGGNVYFSLSGHGVGFWDDDGGKECQAALEEYSGNHYRFECLDLSRDADGKLDMSFLPEFIDDYRNRMFNVNA